MFKITPFTPNQPSTPKFAVVTYIALSLYKIHNFEKTKFEIGSAVWDSKVVETNWLFWYFK